MRIRYKDDALGPFKDGDILRVPMTMDANTVLRREFGKPRQRLRDGLHRPGFRTSSTRINARDAIVSA